MAGLEFMIFCYFCLFSLSQNNSVKPTLKKVSKYENKFAKLQKKAAEFNFRNQLKVVKKKEFTMEEEEKEVRKIEIFAQILPSSPENECHIFAKENYKEKILMANSL